MADPPRRRKPPEGTRDARAPGRPGVIRRAPGAEKRPLPPEAVAVDRGEPVWSARRRPQLRAPELRDPRAEAMVAGVANRAARRVYDAAVTSLRALREAAARDGASEVERAALGDALLDASRLSIWEARRVVGFDAFVEDVIGMPAGEAHELVAASEARHGWTCTPIPPYARAVVLRARAVCLEAPASETTGRATVTTTGDGAGLRIVLDAPGPDAAAAFAAVGRVLWPLAEDLAQGPPQGPRGHGPRGGEGPGGAGHGGPAGPGRGRDRRS
ncbi:MAG: hypothetical protein IT379_08890 [Deltaproteobacteria bacterium]|nr:hypothetical protein [Deltaproteobacteria bacterium]